MKISLFLIYTMFVSFSFAQSQLELKNYSSPYAFTFTNNNELLMCNSPDFQSYRYDVSKFDTKGKLLWYFSSAEENKIKFYDMKPLSNGDIIISGSLDKYFYFEYDLRPIDAFLFRLNTCGEFEWMNIETRYPRSKFTVWERFWQMSIDDNDNIWVVNDIDINKDTPKEISKSKISGNLSICKYNSEGKLLNWTDDFFFRNNCFIKTIIPTHDGGAMAVGQGPFFSDYSTDTISGGTNATKTRSLVVKYDESCNIEWYNAYGTNKDIQGVDTLPLNVTHHFTNGNDIVELGNGHYLIAAEKKTVRNAYPNENFKSILLYEIDLFGNIIWEHIFNEGEFLNSLPKLNLLNDSILMITSGGKHFQALNKEYPYQIHVWKVNIQNKTIINQYIDSNTTYSNVFDTQLTKDGNLIISSRFYHKKKVLPKIHSLNTETMKLDAFPKTNLDIDEECNSVIIEDYVFDIPDSLYTHKPIYLGIEGKNDINLWITNDDELVYQIQGPSKFTSYKIFNILGQEITQGEIKGLMGFIKINTFIPGTYVFSIFEGNKTSASRKIILH